MKFTLVPFAGFNLIRFRGSRINGLSPHALPRRWALRQDNARWVGRGQSPTLYAGNASLSKAGIDDKWCQRA